MKLIDLSVIKVLGSFKLPNGNIIPSVFLSRSKLEVLEDNINININNNNNNNNNNDDDNKKSSVILCDVLPVLINDNKYIKSINNMINNNDNNENSKGINRYH